jgi:protein phosphatase
MPRCISCGAANRKSARFCYQCSTPLPPEGALNDDTAWLAATLGADPASDLTGADLQPTTPSVAGQTQELSDAEGEHMDQPSIPAPSGNPPTPALFADRYELSPVQGDAVEAIDRQPWQRCWACGATSNEAGELFCIECGASLDGRRYRGQMLLESESPVGLALATQVADPTARETLPEIWDQVHDDDALLTLIVDSGRTPVAPPLAELDALHVGLGLARLLQTLHAEGLALGAISVADVELTASGAPRLRNAPNMRRIADLQADVAADMQVITALLEALTETPRTTKRLSDEQAEILIAENGLAQVLSDLRTGTVANPASLAERLDTLIAARTRPIALPMRVGATTHEGMIRELDEDSMLALELRMNQNAQDRAWGLFIVADGMGGHAAGEVASGLAIRGAAEVVLRAYLAPTLEADMQYDEKRAKEIVRKAIQQANEYVLHEGAARGNDMGTTITMALVIGDRAVIGNVGDSRTYIYRDGALRRVSQDHSLVMRLVQLGQIAEDDIYTHPQRNAVLRSLGDKSDIEIDLFVERLKPGDALFLCSDGQWEMTRDSEMAAIIQEQNDPQAACDALIAAGNAAGGEDNITAVLVRFDDLM